MSEFYRQVERQVLRTRALCAEDQRDEWKARAEKAERRVKASEQFPDEQKERLARRAIANLRRAREAERQHAADASKDAVFIYVAEKRAERAEALLLEAPTRHAALCLMPNAGCRCGMESWWAKVRDLLETEKPSGG